MNFNYQPYNMVIPPESLGPLFEFKNAFLPIIWCNGYMTDSLQGCGWRRRARIAFAIQSRQAGAGINIPIEEKRLKK